MFKSVSMLCICCFFTSTNIKNLIIFFTFFFLVNGHLCPPVLGSIPGDSDTALFLIFKPGFRYAEQEETFFYTGKSNDSTCPEVKLCLNMYVTM